LQAILAAAGHAPDHGCLLPWRFVLKPQQARTALGDTFAQALHERDATAALSSRRRHAKGLARASAAVAGGQ
jgi:nitroreductase